MYRCRRAGEIDSSVVAHGGKLKNAGSEIKGVERRMPRDASEKVKRTERKNGWRGEKGMRDCGTTSTTTTTTIRWRRTRKSEKENGEGSRQGEEKERMA